MKKISVISRILPGFSLAEMLAALLIAAMVLVAVLGVYSRAEQSSGAIKRKLDGSRLPREVLQRIAEDMDKIVTPDSDTKITVENKFDSRSFPTARLTIAKTVQDRRGRPQKFEEIIWQATYDYDNDANSLVLYRSHSGMGMEDKLLDESKEDWERELFIPVCSGVTFFRIQVPRGKDLSNSWTNDPLPAGIVVTISFAEPFRTLDNTLDVPDEEKITRAIAIDRTRRIRFIIEKK